MEITIALLTALVSILALLQGWQVYIYHKDRSNGKASHGAHGSYEHPKLFDIERKVDNSHNEIKNVGNMLRDCGKKIDDIWRRPA